MEVSDFLRYNHYGQSLLFVESCWAFSLERSRLVSRHSFLHAFLSTYCTYTRNFEFLLESHLNTMALLLYYE